MAREGLLIHQPYERLNKQQVEQIHSASVQLLWDPGMISWNCEAAEIFSANGAEVTPVPSAEHPYWVLKIPERLILQAINDAPKVVKLGARNRDNTVTLNCEEPRVHFMGPGNETGMLEVDFETYIKKSEPGVEIQRPVFHHREEPLLDDLGKMARLCEHLESVDIFQPCVKITDKGITEDNKVVNMAFACLNNTTKHVKSSFSRITENQLDQVIKMAEIIVGGAEEFKDNPIISFSFGPLLSPLQFDATATQSLIMTARRGVPVFFGVNPQPGVSAPMLEGGVLAQANAEGLAMVALVQLANKGTPMIYTASSLISRMDNFSPSWSAPETNQYYIDFVQMARFYEIPCYVASGVANAKIPGIQASVEKMLSHVSISMAGPQCEWLSLGNLDNLGILCPIQVVLDDAHIQMVKYFLKSPRIGENEISEGLKQVREVMGTPTKQFIRYIRPFLRTEQIAPVYPFESGGVEDEVLQMAYNRMQQLVSQPVEHIDPDTTRRIFSEIPGILPKLKGK